MAVDDAPAIAGVCLAGDSRVTWLITDVLVEADSLVVVEVNGERFIGRVRIAPGAIVAGRVEPAGGIVGHAGPQDLTDLASRHPTQVNSDPRLGGIGRLGARVGGADIAPLLDEFESTLPRLGERLNTARGAGTVERLSLRDDMMTVRLESGEEIDLPRGASAHVSLGDDPGR